MAIDRPCEECGATFPAKTKRAKYCTTACRVRANRRPSKVGKAKAEAAGAVVVPIGKSAPVHQDAEGGLATQVRETLTELDALTTVAGMAALMVARQIDKGQDSGSAVATLSKELSRLMTEARAEAAPKQRDGVDDVMRRAAEKLLRLAQ